MRGLDKTKVYDLSELTSEERNEILKETTYFEDNEENYLAFINNDFHLLKKVNFPHSITNAKELFYTLENIQVDCSELSEYNIKEMAYVFEKAGYEIGTLNFTRGHHFLRFNYENYVFVGTDWVEKGFYTITYEKFIELFSRKEENFKKLFEVLNDELTEKAYKENPFIEEVNKIEIENYNKLNDREKSIYIDYNEKPNKYNIGIDTFNPQPHYNNENGSLYKIANDLGLNHWEFDIFKRLVRCRKKGQFKEDLNKIKDTINIYIREYE